MYINKVYSYAVHDVTLHSGDLIATTDGDDTFVSGQFWRLIGKLIPGAVDHIVIYTGPDGRCVEANGEGVKVFAINDNIWDSDMMKKDRGGLLDSFYGSIYPLTSMQPSEEELGTLRQKIANYCLQQAQLNKKYNLNFFDPETEESFYCSQLAYKAYQTVGINLNTGIGVPNILGTEKIIFPQEIWNGYEHNKSEL